MDVSPPLMFSFIEAVKFLKGVHYSVAIVRCKLCEVTCLNFRLYNSSHPGKSVKCLGGKKEVGFAENSRVYSNQYSLLLIINNCEHCGRRSRYGLLISLGCLRMESEGGICFLPFPNQVKVPHVLIGKYCCLRSEGRFFFA